MSRLAVVDDDDAFSAFLVEALEQAGLEVAAFPTPMRFLTWLKQEKPSLLVLDMNLPGISGFDLIEAMRRDKNLPRFPVLAVSAIEKDSPSIIRGIDLGADEYLVKPFPVEEFIIRVKNLLRRGGADAPRPADAGKLELPPLLLDYDAHEARMKDKPLDLANLEFELLRRLAENRNRALGRGQLFEELWNEGKKSDLRVVDKHVQNLRRKLGPFGKRIETVFNVGYMLRWDGG